MDPGKVSIEPTLSTKLIHYEDRLRESELTFTPEHGARIVPGLGNGAFHCPKCDTLILRGTWSDSLACFECGEIVPAGAGACPSCGWTWAR